MNQVWLRLSGQVMGGFLARMGTDRVPRGARLLTLTWNGDASVWATRQHVPGRWQHFSIAPPAQPGRIAHVLHVGDSGTVLVYDRHGRWRSTYQLGQLNAADIAHDLRVLEGSGE